MRKFKFSKKIHTQQKENNNPDSQVNFTVKYLKTVNLVNIA